MRSHGVVFALLVACSSAAGPGLGDQFTLRVGESASIAELGVWMRFIQVVEDSRCPASVVCVWSGNGAIRLDITTGRGAEPVTLNTAGGNLFPNEASAAGYTFTLVQLDPQRQTTAEVPAEQYRATIRVTRAQ